MTVKRATLVVASCTMCTRITGYLRECVLQNFFGASFFLDLFYASFRIINFFRHVFAEGAFNVTYIGILKTKLPHPDEKSSNITQAVAFYQKSLTLMIFYASIVTVLLYVFFPQMLYLTAHGIMKKDPQMCVFLSRLATPFLLFISALACMSATLNALSSFAIPACLQITINLTVTAAAIFAMLFSLTPASSVVACMIAICASGGINIVIAHFALKKHGFTFKPTSIRSTPETKKMFASMVPIIISTGMWQLNSLVDINILSFLESGSIALASAADRINQIPLAIIGISISTALLPYLIDHIHKNNTEKIQHDVQNICLASLFFALLSTVFLTAFPDAVVACLYQFTSFSIKETMTTAKLCLAYSIGIPGFIFYKIFLTVFHAHKDYKTPVWLSAIAIFVNISSSVLLLPIAGITAVPLSTSVAFLVYAFMLVMIANKKFHLQYTTIFTQKIYIHLITATLTSIVLYIIQKNIWHIAIAHNSIRYIYAIGFVITCIGLYLLASITLSKIWKHKRMPWCI